MGMTKYASFEVSEILDVKGSRQQAPDASLAKLGSFDEYRTEDGYLYVRIRAISSRVNKNHDGWPSVELAGGQDIFDRHLSSARSSFTLEADAQRKYGYSTFLGKPIYVDHHNSDPKRARGVIVDAKLHVEDARTAAELDPYYASAADNHKPPTWVELLLEVDAKAFPKLAKAIIAGSKDPSQGIDGFSMGCDVERSVCNICKNSATSPHEFCDHIRMKGAVHSYKDPQTGQRMSKRSYEDCFGVKFFEISAVFDPADETALTREIRASVQKEGNPGLAHLPCQRCKGRGLEGYGDCPECQGTGVQDAKLLLGPAHGEGAVTPSRVGPGEANLDTAYHQLGPVHHGHTAMAPGQVEACPQCGAQLTEGPRGLQCLDCGHTPQHPHFYKDNPHQVIPGDMYGMDAIANVRTAENPPPQSDLLHAPEPVNTLRKETVCPVCGSEIQDQVCDLCGYVVQPQGFDNPDLQKAQQVRDQREQEGQPVQNSMPASQLPTNQTPLSHVKGDMHWKIVSGTREAGRINTVERPISPTPSPNDEPVETVISDSPRPVTSTVRTASDYIAAAGRNKENNMDKVADAASGAPSAAAPDKRVDVTGVGGVLEPSNEQASQADGQVDVEGRGGTGVENVSPDHTESLEETSENAGFDKGGDPSNNSGPTTTWHGTDGNGVTKQEDPVGGDTFPAKDEGVKKSHDAGDFPEDDNGIAQDSGAVKGVKPITEQFGDRVDVLDSTTSPANNSGPTKTWSGTDGNGVLKQQEPVTTEVFAPFTSHTVNILKLADLEIDLGLLEPEKKYARIAELEKVTQERVASELAYAQRVKTAGLAKSAAVATAKRLPVLGRPTQHAASQIAETDPMEGTLFGL